MLRIIVHVANAGAAVYKLIVTTLLVSFAASAEAQDSKPLRGTQRNFFEIFDEKHPRQFLYDCVVRDSVTASGGTLAAGNRDLTQFRSEYARFSVNAMEAVFWASGRRIAWQPIEGTEDIIAILPGPDPLQHVFRLDVQAKPMTFLLTNRMEALSGTCERKP